MPKGSAEIALLSAMVAVAVFASYWNLPVTGYVVEEESRSAALQGIDDILADEPVSVRNICKDYCLDSSYDGPAEAVEEQNRNPYALVACRECETGCWTDCIQVALKLCGNPDAEVVFYYGTDCGGSEFEIGECGSESQCESAVAQLNLVVPSAEIGDDGETYIQQPQANPLIIQRILEKVGPYVERVMLRSAPVARRAAERIQQSQRVQAASEKAKGVYTRVVQKVKGAEQRVGQGLQKARETKIAEAWQRIKERAAASKESAVQKLAEFAGSRIPKEKAQEIIGGSISRAVQKGTEHLTELEIQLGDDAALFARRAGENAAEKILSKAGNTPKLQEVYQAAEDAGRSAGRFLVEASKGNLPAGVIRVELRSHISEITKKAAADYADDILFTIDRSGLRRVRATFVLGIGGVVGAGAGYLVATRLIGPSAQGKYVVCMLRFLDTLYYYSCYDGCPATWNKVSQEGTGWQNQRSCERDLSNWHEKEVKPREGKEWETGKILKLSGPATYRDRFTIRLLLESKPAPPAAAPGAAAPAQPPAGQQPVQQPATPAKEFTCIQEIDKNQEYQLYCRDTCDARGAERFHEDAVEPARCLQTLKSLKSGLQGVQKARQPWSKYGYITEILEQDESGKPYAIIVKVSQSRPAESKACKNEGQAVDISKSETCCGTDLEPQNGVCVKKAPQRKTTPSAQPPAPGTGAPARPGSPAAPGAARTGPAQQKPFVLCLVYDEFVDENVYNCVEKSNEKLCEEGKPKRNFDSENNCKRALKDIVAAPPKPKPTCAAEGDYISSEKPKCCSNDHVKEPVTVPGEPDVIYQCVKQPEPPEQPVQPQPAAPATRVLINAVESCRAIGYESGECRQLCSTEQVRAGTCGTGKGDLCCVKTKPRAEPAPEEKWVVCEGNLGYRLFYYCSVNECGRDFTTDELKSDKEFRSYTGTDANTKACNEANNLDVQTSQRFVTAAEECTCSFEGALDYFAYGTCTSSCGSKAGAACGILDDCLSSTLQVQGDTVLCTYLDSKNSRKAYCISASAGCPDTGADYQEGPARTSQECEAEKQRINRAAVQDDRLLGYGPGFELTNLVQPSGCSCIFDDFGGYCSTGCEPGLVGRACIVDSDCFNRTVAEEPDYGQGEELGFPISQPPEIEPEPVISEQPQNCYFFDWLCV